MNRMTLDEFLCAKAGIFKIHKDGSVTEQHDDRHETKVHDCDGRQIKIIDHDGRQIKPQTWEIRKVGHDDEGGW